MMSSIQTYVTNANAVKQQATILAGDFNFPNIAWDTTSVTPSLSRDANSSARYLLNFLQQNFMSQYVSTPTRFNNILDLVISDSDRLIHHTEVQPTNLSDHDLVRVTLPFNPKATPEPDIPSFDPDSFRSLDIHKADYDQINLHLQNIDWDSLKNSCPPADFPDLLYRTTFQACALSTPVKVVTPAALSKPARFRRTLSRKKRKLNARLHALQSHNPTSPTILKLKDELNIIQIKLKDSIYSQLKFKESKVIQSIKDNPRFFFSFAKQKSKVKSSIGPLLDSDGTFHTSPKSMADLLQSQYSSVFSNPDDPNAKTPLLNPQFSQPLIDFSFTTADIQKAIEEIDENSSCGDKDIPAKVLRQCRANLSYPIYLIWEESLNQGKILSPQLKDQIISPIHKKGSRADPAEYRPISLTSHLTKIFERIMRDRIVSHLEELKRTVFCVTTSTVLGRAVAAYSSSSTTSTRFSVISSTATILTRYTLIMPRLLTRSTTNSYSKKSGPMVYVVKSTPGLKASSLTDLKSLLSTGYTPSLPSSSVESPKVRCSAQSSS